MLNPKRITKDSQGSIHKKIVYKETNMSTLMFGQDSHSIYWYIITTLTFMFYRDKGNLYNRESS